MGGLSGSAVARAAASLLAANARRPAGALAGSTQHGALGSDADLALTAMYDTHYRALIQLAAILVSDVAMAEEIVQDAFVGMHRGWRQLRDRDEALPYLRQAVVRRSRSRYAARPGPCRRQPDQPAAGQPPVTQPPVTQPAAPQPPVTQPAAPQPPVTQPAAPQPAATQPDLLLAAALRALPARQREALALRYYTDLPETQIAMAMGISTRSVSIHVARGISAVQAALERGHSAASQPGRAARSAWDGQVSRGA
jgi:RNA polymerase sigma factor (sigma-70 family)